MTDLCFPIIPGWKKSVHAFTGFNFNTASNITAWPSALNLHCASTGPQSPNTKSCSLSTFDGVPNTVLGSSSVPSVLTGHLLAHSHVYLALRKTCISLLLGFETIPFVSALINASRFASSPPFAVVRQS